MTREEQNEALRQEFDKALKMDPELRKYWPLSDMFLAMYPQEESENVQS